MAQAVLPPGLPPLLPPLLFPPLLPPPLPAGFEQPASARTMPKAAMRGKSFFLIIYIIEENGERRTCFKLSMVLPLVSSSCCCFINENLLIKDMWEPLKTEVFRGVL
jgi:hypothetical protein